MPNELASFPQFPTTWTEQESKRLRELEVQRKKMEEVYQKKFTPEAWAGLSTAERAFREATARFAPGWVGEKIIPAITAWEWGWEYGLTPEQATTQRVEVEAEYKELARQERITTELLPQILAGIELLAMKGELITDRTEFRQRFKLEEMGFNEEEIGWVTDFAIRLAQTPAGQVPHIPDTEEAIREWLTSRFGAPTIDPRFIMSTVAFSKDLEQIGEALQVAYPPQVEVKEPTATEMWDELLAQRTATLAAWLRELGVTPKEGESTQDTIERALGVLTEKEGELIILTDGQSGDMIIASKKSNNRVWAKNPETGEEELLGYYDEEQKGIVPIGLDGQPLRTEQEQESKLKDLWDRFYLGLMEAKWGAREGLDALCISVGQFGAPDIGTGEVPIPTREQWKDTEGLKGILPPHLWGIRALSYEEGIGEIERINSGVRETNDILRQSFEQRQAEHTEWLKEHPEYIPRAAYSQDPIANPELLKDPYFYAYTIAGAAPIISAALLTGLGVGIATKNPMVGAVAGAAVITPVMSGEIYKQVMEAGADPINAGQIATTVGIAAGAVEIFPGMLVLRAVVPTAMRTFGREFTKDLAKHTVARMSVRGILKTGGKIEVAEIIEELIQESMLNASVKMIDESRGIFDNLSTTAILTAIAVLPLAAFGMGGEYMNMRAHLPPDVKTNIDERTQELEDAGLSGSHAEVTAVTELLETEQGRAQVFVAAEKADETPKSVPVEPVGWDKVEWDKRIPVGVRATIREIVDDLPQEMRTKLSSIKLNLRLKMTTARIWLKGDKRYLEFRSLDDAVRPSTIYHEIAHGLVSDMFASKNLKVLEEYVVAKEFGFEINWDKVKAKADAYMKKHNLLLTTSPEEKQIHFRSAFYSIYTGLEENFARDFSEYVRGLEQSIELEVFFKEFFPKGEMRKNTPEKIAKLETKLKSLNNDLEVFHKSIKLQEESLEKMRAGGLTYEVTEQLELLSTMKETLEDLENDFVNTVKQLKKLREEKAKPPVKKVKPVTKKKVTVSDKIATGTPYTATVYRGIKEGVAPVDVGLYGKGTYYTTNREYAETYGTVETSTINLKNPFVIKTQTEADAFWDETTRPAREQAIREGKTPEEADELAAVAARNFLEGKGYDGVIARNIVAKGDEVVVFHPAEEVAPTVPGVEEGIVPEVPEVAVSPTVQEREFRPSVFTAERIPRFAPLDAELKAINEAVMANPQIAKHIRADVIRKKTRTEAEEALEGLHTKLSEIKSREEETGEDLSEETKGVTDEFKELAKKAGLRKKVLLAKHWGDMSPPEQASLALAMLPDKSIPFMFDWKWLDSRFVLLEWERLTGQPFHVINKRMLFMRGHIDTLRNDYAERLNKNSQFKHIVNDKDARIRVALEVNSRDPESGVKSPEGLTDTEKAVADTIQSIYDEWKPIVRTLRFIEAYEIDSDVKAINKLIPDAPELDLALAKEIYETQGEDALWSFLFDRTWGVRETGYDPRIVSQPNLLSRLPPLSSARGRGRLLTRELNEFVTGKEDEIFGRLDSYILSMGVRWFLRNEIGALAELNDKTWNKWESPEDVQKYLRGYLNEMQGLPMSGSLLDWALGRTYALAAPIIFWHPWLCFRNTLQPLWAFPYRSELFRSLVEYRTIPNDARFKAGIYFNTVVDQSKKAIQSFMFQGENVAYAGKLSPVLQVAIAPFKIALKPLSALSRLANRTSLFPLSDYISREWGYGAAFQKVWRASNQYLKDGDVDSWIKNSGIGYLTQTQQDYILGTLAQPEVHWNIPGLENLTGAEAASLIAAEEIVNTSLYLYNRFSRSQAEWGGMGRVLGSLLVFPRSTAQMYYLQGAKVLSKETSVEEKATATKNIVMLIVAGEVLSAFLTGLSGRRRKEYAVVDIFNWELGGLSIGLARDVTGFIGDIMYALGGGDKDLQDRVIQSLPGQASSLGNTFVGFYKILIDTIEAMTDTTGIDKHYMRKLIGWFDEKYTPEEQEAAERDTIEKIQHILAGSEAVDPTVHEQALKDLAELEGKLGERDLLGKFYTLEQLSGNMKTILNPFPSDMVSEDYGFSKLATFYKECEDAWDEYFELPTVPGDVRQSWRRNNLDVEAMLLFWGKYNRPISGLTGEEVQELQRLIISWFSVYKIDWRYEHPYFPDWTLLPRTE